MAQTNALPADRLARRPGGRRSKFWMGGALIAAAIAYLIITSTQSSAQYFLTVDELRARAGTLDGREVRVSGAVIGDSIRYDAQNLRLTFTVAHLPADATEIESEGGLAAALAAAVANPDSARLPVVYEGPKPDLLRHEAQAIMTGRLGSDGVFHADELLLKCPTRYEEMVPGQTTGG